ncbi:Protein msta, isoform A [Orchesella cincta]|uniref:Protein msta, isoform A n=1 Tax=Orchesella cincta TaxID=48709 RepID=A0A1D2MXQ3_ORCCI|nr:Protein msta, isoform A [Orchesella cincta]
MLPIANHPTMANQVTVKSHPSHHYPYHFHSDTEVDLTTLRFTKPPEKTMTPGKPRKTKKTQNGGTYRLLKSCSTNLICAVCFANNARVCQGCHNIAYCCRDHQIEHWSIHQSTCKPLVCVQKEEVLNNLSLPLEERHFDPYIGMYKAARQLNPKDTVLHLQPIMHVAHNKGLPVPPDSILCLGCNRWYQRSQGYMCRKCKWPVCSEKCELESCHSLYECKIFFENQIMPPPNPSMFDGDAILALRCLLLKDVKPLDWEKLSVMEPLVAHLERPRHCVESDEKIARFVMYQCHLNKTMGLTFQGVMNFLKVIDFCSIWLPERSASLWDKQFSFVSAKYVFPSKVFIGEECSPNCSWSLRHSPILEECSLRLKASVVIHEGQFLTACFTGISEYGATFSKRYENCRFTFKCSCRRCLDPTELGSFFSGVKCTSCDDFEQGYLLPETPAEGNASWRCFNTACCSTADGTSVSKDVNKIHKEIIENTNSLQGLLTLLKANEGDKLHRNHYLIMKATTLAVDLCWGVCKNSALHVIGNSLLEKGKVLTEKLANIYKAVYPWNSIQNAKLLFHYQLLHGVAKIRELLWLFQQNKMPIEDNLLWPNEFWDILQIQKAALDVLMDEPLGSVERENAILMKGVLEDTESLLVLERRNNRIQYETLMGLQKVYSRYCSSYLYSVLPIFEDKELNELLLFTGPYCKDLLDKAHSV